jgi:hypothetical protein
MVLLLVQPLANQTRQLEHMFVFSPFLCYIYFMGVIL